MQRGQVQWLLQSISRYELRGTLTIVNQLPGYNTAQRPGHVVVEHRALRRPVVCGGQQRIEAQQKEHRTVHGVYVRSYMTTLSSSLDLLCNPDDDRVFLALVGGPCLRKVQCEKVLEHHGAEAALQAHDEPNRFFQDR